MRRIDREAKLVALAIAGLTLAGCASSVPRNAPDWYRNALHHEQHGFPNLRDVPRTSNANIDPAHWAQLQAELEASKQQMQANPRSEPAPPQDPDGFIDDARGAIEATRSTHKE